MTENQRQIMKAAMPQWKEEDFEISNAIEETMKTQGWKYLEKIWAEQREAIFSMMQKARKEDCVWRLIGVMEGHDVTKALPSKLVKEKNDREAVSQAQSTSEEFENAAFG